MQPYPTYQQMNNPYAQMNNMYAQPNNPYADRMNFLQNYQQSLQQPMVPTQMSGANQMSALGKMVDSIDVVKATDIPMDGNAYYFPKADGTEVYCKQWLQNGTTRILTFKPLLDSETNNLPLEEEKLKFDTFKAFLDGIQEDIKTLNDKVDKLSKPNRAKKEVLEDE